MATIESRPLPPLPGSGGQIAKITEADRAEIMAQANAVIDFYLNGPGSFSPDGLRKPVEDEPDFDSTIQDLKNFKDSVTAAKQFADDPSGILDSVIELIRKSGDQIQTAERDHATIGPDVKDSLTKPSPDIVDRLNYARVPHPDSEPSVPRDTTNGSLRGQPITLQTPSSPFTQKIPASAVTPPRSSQASDWPQASPPLQPDASNNGPTRFLVGRTYDPSQSPPFAVRPAPPPPAPDGPLSLNDAYLEYLRRLNVASSQPSTNS